MAVSGVYGRRPLQDNPDGRTAGRGRFSERITVPGKRDDTVVPPTVEADTQFDLYAEDEAAPTGNGKTADKQPGSSPQQSRPKPESDSAKAAADFDTAAARKAQTAAQLRAEYRMPTSGKVVREESVDQEETSDFEVREETEAAGRKVSLNRSGEPKALKGVKPGFDEDAKLASLYEDAPPPPRYREYSAEAENAIAESVFEVAPITSQPLLGSSSTFQKVISADLKSKTPAIAKGQKPVRLGEAPPKPEPLEMPLWSIGKVPEMGNPENVRPNYASAPEKIGSDIEEAHFKNNYGTERPMQYTYRQRLNKINDPAMDPSNPLYDYNTWFDRFILKSKLTRLVKPEDYRAGNNSLYYPFDYRRYVLRSPFTNHEAYMWIQNAADAKLDDKLIRKASDDLLELKRISSPDPRNLIYSADGDTEDARRNFDLLHLSDQYMGHAYSDMDKLRTYLEGNHPFGTHLRELARRVVDKVQRTMPSRDNPPLNPWSSVSFTGHEFGELKNALHGRPATAKKSSNELNLVHPHYDSVLDLHKLLFKRKPVTPHDLFGSQINEMAKLEEFSRGRSADQPWAEKALADIKRPYLPMQGLGTLLGAKYNPFSDKQPSAHYKTAFHEPSDVLSVLPEAAPLFSKNYRSPR